MNTSNKNTSVKATSVKATSVKKEAVVNTVNETTLNAITTLKAQVKGLEVISNRLKSRVNLDDKELDLLGATLCQITYKNELLSLSNQVLELIAKNNSGRLDNIARNKASKVAFLAGLALDGKGVCFENTNYGARFVSRILNAEKLDSDFTFTAGQLAANLGSPCPITGVPKRMTTSTQPYALMSALEFLTDSKRVKADKGASWEATTFTLKVQSDLVKGLNLNFLKA